MKIPLAPSLGMAVLTFAVTMPWALRAAPKSAAVHAQ
jgi:hypothetical protein